MHLFSLPFIRTYKEITPRVTIYLVHFFLLVIALFLQAYMHNYNIVYITLFVLFGLAMSTCYFGRKNLKYLSLQTLYEGRIFAKRDTVLHWNIHNKNANPSYDVNVTCNDSLVHLQHLFNDTPLRITQRFESRGKAHIDTLMFESGFPLPHLRFRRTLKAFKKVMVYPEPKGISLAQFIDAHPSSFGERDDFEGIRRYETSDTPSLIHWPSLAKSGELSSRHYSYRYQSDMLHFDFIKAGNSDEERLSQLCLWVLECEKQQRSFSIKMPHTTHLSTKESVDAILLALAQY